MPSWIKSNVNGFIIPDVEGIDRIQIELPNEMTTVIRTPEEPYHGFSADKDGIGEHNAGWVRGVQSISITFKVPITSSTNRLLRALHTSKNECDIIIIDSEGAGLGEFQPLEESFYRCRILSRSANYTRNGIPINEYEIIALTNDFKSFNKDGSDTYVVTDVTDNDIYAHYGEASTELNTDVAKKLLDDYFD